MRRLANHALPFAVLLTCLAVQPLAGQTERLSTEYQKWLDEDVRYLISDQDRADLVKLTTDQQRDKFIEGFWERRNPNPGSPENIFKAEHYRRLAYANQHFASEVAGYRTDRGRIYIIFGPPDEREQHPGRTDIGIPTSAPASVRYPSDVWRYQDMHGVGRNVTLEFIDTCRCGKFQLIDDATQKHLPNGKE
jgi:GWxTD domain-containing protein